MQSKCRVRSCSPARSTIAAITAIGLLSPVLAQNFSASTFGSVNVDAGYPFVSSFGPAIVPASGVGLSVQNGNTMAQASASASASSSAVSLQATANSGPYLGQAGASANLTLTLVAPVGAGVRIQVSETVRTTLAPQAFVRFANQSYSGPVSGPASGSQTYEVLVPAGGLRVSITLTATAYPQIGNGPGVDCSLSVFWSYPGVVSAGAATPGCLGPAVCWTRGIPRAGNASFGLTCANAHPQRGGVSVLGLGGLTVPFVYDFVNVWVNPALPISTLYVPSNAAGEMLYPLPIPAGPTFLGWNLWGQFLLLEPPGCMPLDLSGSNAVRFTILQ